MFWFPLCIPGHQLKVQSSLASYGYLNELQYLQCIVMGISVSWDQPYLSLLHIPALPKLILKILIVSATLTLCICRLLKPSSAKTEKYTFCMKGHLQKTENWICSLLTFYYHLELQPEKVLCLLFWEVLSNKKSLVPIYAGRFTGKRGKCWWCKSWVKTERCRGKGFCNTAWNTLIWLCFINCWSSVTSTRKAASAESELPFPSWGVHSRCYLAFTEEYSW